MCQKGKIKMKHSHEEIRKIIPEMRRVQQIHFIGIGGAGMSGIAEILLNEGYQSRVQILLTA